MSPRQAEQTDPIQRLILMSTYEALEQAGYSYESSGASNVATFIGQSSDDWREVNAAQNIDTFHIPGGIRAFVPGRLSYHFGWEGPAVSIDTACSSSAASIDLACSALLSKKCGMAVAGGANIMTTPDLFAGLSRGGFLSLTGSCKTWDETADGYCRADAVGVVVLKRLKDAIANRDPILAILKSAVTNHSPQASSITHPHTETQAKLMRAVLREARVTPEQVDYIEMHGTGTQAGDVAETKAVHAVFEDHGRPDGPLFLGTIKPNVGHGEAASGVSSVIKAVLMLGKSSIPAHVGIKTTVNKKIPDLPSSGILIPMVKTPFPAHRLAGRKRNVLVNNFNATSGSTSLLLSDGLESVPEGKDPRKAHIITISAHSNASLRANLSRLERYLADNPNIEVPSLSYSTTARRMHHGLRRAYVANDILQLSAAIKEDLETLRPSGSGKQAAPIVFCFTGQASRLAGMGSTLFATSSTFRNSILRSDRACQSLALPTFVQIISNPIATLADFDSVQSQLALVALEVALTDLWRSWGIEPTAVIGHSLGEYAALFAAGMYSLTDMFYLVGTRAKLLQKTFTAGSHGMLSVRMAIAELERVIQGLNCPECEIACHNTLTSNTVAGPTDQIKRLQYELNRRSVTTALLSVPYAFHSAQMDSLIDEVAALSTSVPYQRAQITVASTVTGSIIQREGSIEADHFAKHLRRPVKFVEAVQELDLQGIATNNVLWIEIGPSSVCTNFISNILATPPEQTVSSLIRGFDDWKMISSGVARAYQAGTAVKWREYHREYETSLKLLSLPKYAFDLKSYWIQYEGDWCIHKGRSIPAASPEAKLPGLQSTTLQKIGSEKLGIDEATVTFETNLKEERLYAAIAGHRVNDSPLCPSSIYADMALTAASYIHRRLWPTQPLPDFDVCQMNVRKPLIAKNHVASQIVKIAATKEQNSNDIMMKVVSTDAKENIHHADWVVTPGKSDSWLQIWQKPAYLYRSRIDCLKQGHSAGRVHHLFGSMVYKLFSSLVTYGPSYQGIQEAFLDGNLSEATALVSLRPNSKDDKFNCSPYWIDSLAHISGFVLNGSDTTPEDTVFISHGWESMRFASPLSENVSYTTYVKMQATGERGVVAGDVQVFQDATIVAVISGLRFQAIKKKLLSSLLPKTSVQISTDRMAGSGSSQEGVCSRGKDVPLRQPEMSSSMSAATALMATQLGAELATLHDDAVLADLGIDSILIVEIQAQLRHELNIDVPSSYFVDPSTMRDFKQFIKRSSSNMTIRDEAHGTIMDEDSDSQGLTLTNPTPTELNLELSAEWNHQVLQKIIAEELEISSSEIESHTKLLELGLDSMLTISILNRVRSSIGQTIPPDFFISYPTLADIETFFATKNKATGLASISTVPPWKPEIESFPEKLHNSKKEKPPADQGASLPTSKVPEIRCSTSFLQLPKTTIPVSPTLILLPDGTGSPAPYTALPTLHPALRVLGLTSPFLHNPSTYTVSLLETSFIFTNTIIQTVPTGPLILGGLSIGGVFAHEVAQQLLTQGREIKGLLFLDSPCPATIPAIKPDALLNILDLLEHLGTFKRPGRPDPKLRPNVREHFYRTAMALEQYKASPPSLEARKIPCEAIWAAKGVLESLGEAEGKKAEEAFRGEDSVARDWLLKERKTTGPQGWEMVLENVRCEAVGTNHFEMFQEGHVGELATLMKRAVGRLLGEA